VSPSINSAAALSLKARGALHVTKVQIQSAWPFTARPTLEDLTGQLNEKTENDHDFKFSLK
jgi:hypothetical protein